MMSQLDAALIKAYGKLNASNERAAKPLSKNVATLMAPSAQRANQPTGDARPAASTVSAAAVPDTGKSAIHTAGRVVPVPHMRISPSKNETAKVSAPRIAAHTIITAHPAADTVPAPHAFGSTGTRIPTTDDAIDVREEAETISVISKVCPTAAFQIERFTKPAVCETLLRKLANPFDHLAEQLIAGLRLRRNLLAIGGSSDQAGATTFVVCVAMKMAEQGLNVVMLDGDWTNPQLAHRLGVKHHLTWQDEALNERSMGECWIESTADRLTMIPLSTPAHGVDEGLVEQVPRFLKELGDIFDLVVIDIGQPANNSLGKVWLGPPVDGLVLVENVRKKDRKRTVQLRHTLDQAKLAWWGVAENFV